MLAALAGCGSHDSVTDALETREVTLPGGAKIVAEVRMRPEQMRFGMMFRDSLPRGRGMLFIHSAAGSYPYWMHNVRIPLDMVFMDSRHDVLEIAAEAPPCAGDPGLCPHYGGHPQTRYVLELAGGEARRLGLRPGDVLAF